MAATKLELQCLDCRKEEEIKQHLLSSNNNNEAD